MKLIVKKENQTIEFIGQEQKKEYSFGIEAIGIKTKKDIHEIIHQCQLIEGQLTDELTNCGISLDKVITVKSDFIHQPPQEP